MILSDDDLFTLAESVWQSMLGLDLVRGVDADAKIGNEAVTACVQITGEWEGAVTVQLDTQLARQIGSAMFMLEPDELGDDEVRDAIGEIANMTGGNVKGLAPGENTLAIPTVVEGDEHALSLPGTVKENQVVAFCNELPVIITVLAKTK